jgi:hypothetical protein
MRFTAFDTDTIARVAGWMGSDFQPPIVKPGNAWERERRMEVSCASGPCAALALCYCRTYNTSTAYRCHAALLRDPDPYQCSRTEYANLDIISVHARPDLRAWTSVQVLDWDARIFLFHNFLSPEECDHIISLSEKRMTRSGVVETNTGGSAVSEIRTSYGVFLDRGQDETLKGEWTDWLAADACTAAADACP